MTLPMDFGVAAEMALVEAKIRKSIVSEEPLLEDIARYVIEAGGKRIRPMVTLLAFKALRGQDIGQAIDLSAALELIHSATLIHDDINDGGEMRRGRPAAYKKFGLQNALITGDFLFVKAFGIVGKRAGTDLREGNMTLLTIHALNDGGSIDARALSRLIAKRRKREDEVQRALTLIRDSGAVEKARAKAFEYGQLAKKSLDPIPDSDAKQSMIRLVDFVLSRDV